MKPVEKEALRAAFKMLEVSLNRRTQRVLVVEDDDAQRHALEVLIRSDDVEPVGVRTANAALAALLGGRFDCVVTDLALPDVSGFDLIERISTDSRYGFAPVIVYTGRVLDRHEELRLRKHSRSIIVKGARSAERLLDEVQQFLHQVEGRKVIGPASPTLASDEPATDLKQRTVLLVEDDVRNVFALSAVLEQRSATVLIARNGREAIDVLTRTPNIDLVLMDIMMPVMDGFAATREIRTNPAWKDLPIIALTAKAGQDDQRRCLEAGANDYASKPLDVDRLLERIRVWMPN